MALRVQVTQNNLEAKEPWEISKKQRERERENEGGERGKGKEREKSIIAQIDGTLLIQCWDINPHILVILIKGEMSQREENIYIKMNSSFRVG